MKIISRPRQLQHLVHQLKLKRKTIGFVPTMGYLHNGHLSLVRKSKKENDVTVLSIFVNPTQFGPREDYARYPRDKKSDENFARREKVDIIFYPSVKKMYPKRYLTYVTTQELTEVLCGPFRPGHFRGVTTIVCKLLNIVSPDCLYLGQKDMQQAVIIKKMIDDLNIPTKVKICPIVREPDGLAMSSRNTYLTAGQRRDATVLYKALRETGTRIKEGERNPDRIIQQITSLMKTTSVNRIDYVACIDATTLRPVKIIKGRVLIALAVWFGKTRLIDNIIVRVK